MGILGNQLSMLMSSRISIRRFATNGISQKVKRLHPIRNFILKTIVATGFVYGTGLCLALNNEKANELFSDHFPYGEDLLDAYDNYCGVSSLNGVTDIRHKLMNAYNRLSNRRSSKKEVEAVLDEKLVIPVLVQKSLSKLVLPNIEVENANLVVRDLVNSLNSIIQEVNERGLEVSEENFNIVVGVFCAVVNALKSMNESVDVKISGDLKQKTCKTIQQLQQKFNNDLKTKELEIAEDYMNKFETFKENLEQLTAQQLQIDLKAHEQALLARQRNEVAQLSIRQVEEFNKIIESKLEKERNGRLAKLNELDTAVESLIPLFEKLHKHAIKSECLSQLAFTIKNLRTKLTTARDAPVDLNEDIKRLRLLTNVIPNKSKCCKHSLLDIAVTELESKIKDKIVSNEQLYSRWLLLQPELKTTSLLPPNAGFLGHLTAKLFSFLLFTKEGYSTTQDMDSIIARVTENLRTNRLHLALGDVVNLTGWSRRCASDWIELARQRLEVLALIDVIDSDIKTL